MAVTRITITQDNTNGNCDLLAVSSPLIFIIEVEYTIVKPDLLAVDVKDENDDVLGTFKCIEYIYEDDSGLITYRFEASDIVTAFMDSFDDVETQYNYLEYVENITKLLSLTFYIGAESSSITFDAIRAASQIGDYPALENIYNNSNLVFYGSIDEPVYVYFYNDSESNELGYDAPVGEDDAYLDHEDLPYTDNNDFIFRGL